MPLTRHSDSVARLSDLIGNTGLSRIQASTSNSPVKAALDQANSTYSESMVCVLYHSLPKCTVIIGDPLSHFTLLHVLVITTSPKL